MGKKRRSFAPKWQYIGLGVLALATAAVVSSVALAPPRQSDSVPDLKVKAEQYEQQVKDDLAAKSKAVYEANTVAVTFPTDRPLRYLLVGDSLANGAAATEPAKAFRELVGAELAKHAAVDPVLAGKAGQGVALIAPQALAAGNDFDVIVVEVGTNDAGKTDAAQFSAGYAAMIAQLRAQSPSAALVCLGPWRDAKVGGAYLEGITKGCAVAGGRVRDLSPHYMTAVNRWTTGVMSNGLPAEDNFHPSDTGHFEIAAEVLNALRLDGKTA